MRMMLRVAVILGLVISLLLFSWPVAAAPVNNLPKFATDHILVKFKTGTTAISRQAANTRHGGSVIKEISPLKVQVVEVPAGQVTEQIRAYQGDSTVEYAEPDYQVKAIDAPNDSYFNQQWGLTKIQAPEAWNITTGNSTVKIAILDTGIDQDHVDLSAKIVANQNFSASSTVDDLYGHGTLVAGIAGAITNNGIGIAGAGYNCSLMNVKVLDDSGEGLDSAAAVGIIWAADNGARVINISFGGPDPSSTMESAINYAWSKGVVVVAAAGNNGSSTPYYPAYYSNCIAVAATYRDDGRAAFSDYGTWVDVAAPGMDIYSTLPNHENSLGQTSYGSVKNYGSFDGTSMSAPLVSGLAGLIWATPYGIDNGAVRNRIETSTDPIDGTGTLWQYGRINALRSVTTGVPRVITSGATEVTATSATLNGILSGNDITTPVQVSFEYGTSQDYGYTSASQMISQNGTFSIPLSGLSANKTYYFRAKAVGSGTGYGQQRMFSSWVTPPEGKIAFISTREGDYGLYSMKADGSNLTRIGPAGYAYPAFSHDGSRIAFGSVMGGPYSASEIGVINADGSHQIRLTTNGGNERPAWSADGTRIAFQHEGGDSNVDIYVMDAEGTQQVRLTNDPAYEGNPTWSPDDKKIAFISRRDGNSQIYLMDAGGTNQNQLTGDPMEKSEPAWSPDGTRIAYAGFTGHHNDIFVMNADGSNQTQLTAFSNLAGEHPAWSPDGSRISFTTLVLVPGHFGNGARISVMNADGSNLTNITEDSQINYEQTWGPAVAAPVLVFSTSPVDARAGSSFPLAPVVQVKDGNGNLIANFTAPVTVTITGGTGAAGAALAGPTTVNAVNGVATFTGLSINLPFSGYSLTATSGTFIPATSTTFNVVRSGDANGDGLVSIGDVTKTERILLGLDLPTIGADANNNRVISIGDVTKIERIILKLDP